jgi:hypothetical protein
MTTSIIRCAYCGTPIDHTRRSSDCDAFNARIDAELGDEVGVHLASLDCDCSCCAGDCWACHDDLHISEGSPTMRRRDWGTHSPICRRWCSVPLQQPATP